MSDIVERLHKCDLTLHDLIICDEAADTIEALRAENARLRKALEKLASVEGNGVARLALATKEQS